MENVELSPKIFDLVHARRGPDDPTTELLGTVVEFLGTDAVLVEVSDEKGVANEFLSVPLDKIVRIQKSSSRQKGEEGSLDAQSIFEEGILLLQNGLVPAARDRFAKAFTIRPKLAGHLNNLAADLARKGAFESAMVVFRIIVDLVPKYRMGRENLASTHLNHGVECARHGAIDEALHDFTASLLFSSSNRLIRIARHNFAATYTQLGIQHVQTKHFQEALKFFGLAFQVDTSTVPRRNFALALVSALVLRGQEHRVLSKEVFSDAMLMGLTYSECLNTFGATLAGLGRYAEATDVIAQALTADPHNALAASNLKILTKGESAQDLLVSMWGLKLPDLQTVSL